MVSCLDDAKYLFIFLTQNVTTVTFPSFHSRVQPQIKVQGISSVKQSLISPCKGDEGPFGDVMVVS